MEVSEKTVSDLLPRDIKTTIIKMLKELKEVADKSERQQMNKMGISVTR